MIDYGIYIDDFYKYGSKHDVVILNEYDLLINEHSYNEYEQGIKGLWQLKGRNVIAFTATSNTSYERFVNNCITKPTILKFKSEYEMVNGASPISDATILACHDSETMMAAFDNDLAKYYDQKPIIVKNEKEQRDDIIQLLKASKYRYSVGTKDNALHEVRSWEYGVLMLSASEGRGVDARFRRDAIVLVLAKVQSYHEL